MKRLLTLCAGALLLVVTGCDTADTVGPDSAGDFDARPMYSGEGTCDAIDGYEYCVDLVASQTQKVGQVYYDFDGSTFKIRYELTEPGLCLGEVHYGIYDTQNAVPHNRGGNVAPGGLAYSDSPEGCVTVYEETHTVSGIDGDFFIAAHANVVGSDGSEGPECDYIFGIARDGHIYKIRLGDFGDLTDNTSQDIWDTGFSYPETSHSANWPNSLALDALNRRLYFSNVTAFNTPDMDPDPDAALYFLDLGGVLSQHEAGLLSRRSADATTIGSDFYYVSQNITDNLRKVTFNADGTIATREIVCENFTGGDGTPMFFGDLAYKDGVIYGSARLETDDAESTRFFTIDPVTCDYDEYIVEEFLEQLAFDCEDRLIGHNTATGEFFHIDTTAPTFTHTSLGEVPGGIRFNDLASGECRCEPVDFDETAWGWGEKSFKEAFGGNQWGWIFAGN